MIGFLPKYRNINLNELKQWYFVFEGLLCSGKSIMKKKAEAYLKNKEYKVATFENADENIREVFRKTKYTNDFIDAHLFTADTLMINEEIQHTPLDTMILEERSFLSTIAYQDKLGLGTILQWHRIDLNEYYGDFVCTSSYYRFPDVVFILDVGAEEAVRRAKADPNHKIEKYDTIENLERVRKNYKTISKDPTYLFYIHFIEQQPLEDTWLNIKEIMEKHLKTNHSKTKIAAHLRRMGYQSIN